MTSAGIGQAATLPTSDLNLFHKNPRIGNIATIAESLRTNGQYRPIVVNKGTHTGRPNEVLAGNHTLKAYRLNATNNPAETQWHTIDCWIIDVTEEEATRIVLADNRTTDIGTYNNDTLLDLLSDLDHNFEGTGYTDDYIQRLLGDFDPPELEQPEPLPTTTTFQVIIDCHTILEQQQTAEALTDAGYTVRTVTQS